MDNMIIELLLAQSRLSRRVLHDLTFPPEKRLFLSQLLDEVFDGLYGYAMVLSRDRTEAEDLCRKRAFVPSKR